MAKKAKAGVGITQINIGIGAKDRATIVGGFCKYKESVLASSVYNVVMLALFGELFV